MSNKYINLPKTNEVSYTFDTICGPNIMNLAQEVLEIFGSQGHLLHKLTKSKKGDNSVKYKKSFPKRYSGHLHLMHNM